MWSEDVPGVGCRARRGDAGRPLLVVVSAPSGAGKSTLLDRLMADRPDLAYSISCTTRAPRGAEQDGRDYHFLSEAEFKRRIEAGAFLEHAVVHGRRYGTLKKTVEDALAAGRSVVMDIDVQGAAQVREQAARARAGRALRRGFVDIFIEPPSMDVLRRRLEERGEDSPAAIARRLRNAAAEMRRRGEYRYRVVNDDLDTAYRALTAILDREQAASRSRA